MARLQILELPEGSGDDRPPFVLVIDQAPRDETSSAFRRDLADNKIAADIGALAVLVFEDTIDIPANAAPVAVDEAFKSDIQGWAAGTNQTLARIIDAISHPTKRPKRGSSPLPKSDGQAAPDA